ncbi:MAG: hypothetical protein RJQ07_11760 [Pseudomonadales bacterium]
MRITRSILLFITLLGCAGHAAAVVSADWEPERLVLEYEPQNETSWQDNNGKNALKGQQNFNWQQAQPWQRALTAKKALMARKKAERVRAALLDAKRQGRLSDLRNNRWEGDGTPKRRINRDTRVDDQRRVPVAVRPQISSVQSVPEIDGQYAGLALALMLALCLVMRERARQSS